MRKIKKEIIVFIVLLILIFLWALFTQTPVNTSTVDNKSTLFSISTPAGTSTPINTFTPASTSTPIIATSVNSNILVPESQVGGMDIQFKDGISEPEVKTILQNVNMTMNYSMEYDNNITDERYYIMVDKDKIAGVRSEIEKNGIWKAYAPTIIKENYYIITVPEQIIQYKSFLEMLKKYDLQLKRFIWCTIRFRLNDGTKYWVPKEDAIRIKNELEQNENIFSVRLSYIYST